MVRHLTEQELADGLPTILDSPTDNGEVRAIVIRPTTDERITLSECEFSAEQGAHGDTWARTCGMRLEDGSPNPDVQIAIMNDRCINLVADGPARRELAGDNLFVDFDLSHDNLQPGQRLAIGSTLLEITNEAHNGCHKFVARFGGDAVKFVNSPLGKQHRLRGVYAKVIEPGAIKVGDVIRKVQAAAAS